MYCTESLKLKPQILFLLGCSQTDGIFHYIFIYWLLIMKNKDCIDSVFWRRLCFFAFSVLKLFFRILECIAQSCLQCPVFSFLTSVKPQFLPGIRSRNHWGCHTTFVSKYNLSTLLWFLNEWIIQMPACC